MKFKYFSVIGLLLLIFSFQSCEDNDDVMVTSNLDIQDFIWKGLNVYYLWQADVPNLANDRFANQSQLNTFLYGYPVPEKLFDALRVDKTIDRFSWIVDDYLVLEGELQGNTNNNGVDFGLSRKSSGSNEVIGWVRYIIPNSNASGKNIQRGAIFYGVNGTSLTIDNYKSLLFGSNNDYTLNFANYDGGAFTPNEKSVDVTKTSLAENPILINKVIVSGSHTIGYLLYNGFYANYDTALNEAFGSLKSQGITDLVLDLRYNSGGSVQSATRLASMITGSFTGQVFAKQQWNAKIQAYYEAHNADALKNFFTDKMGTTSINSVGMTKIYSLTSKSTASASELVINGLKPYMDVVQIGDTTVGKNVGSVTLYDSPSFGKENRNPNHHYAMQPIVLKIVNADDFGDYFTGLVPTVELKESLSNLDVLGSTTEPLLSTAIGQITGVSRMMKQSPTKEFELFKDSKSITRLQNQMYLDKAPDGLRKAME